jgi:hypothetical protein
MRVIVIDIAPDGTETERCRCDHRDCFPDPTEAWAAERELCKSRRYWAGGGAAPLVLLMRDDE